MKTLEVPVKFQRSDAIYTTRQTKLEKDCSVCEGSGKIKYNDKDMRCPECMGAGKFTTNKVIHIVCDEPFIISTTKITIDNEGSVSVKYKGRCGFVSMNRTEENLFLTKEDTQLRCDELNKEKVFMNVNDIIIKDDFKQTRPSLDKIQEKLTYYKTYNRFNKNIIVDQNKVLQDGYIIYLICKMLNIDFVKVIVE